MYIINVISHVFLIGSTAAMHYVACTLIVPAKQVMLHLVLGNTDRLHLDVTKAITATAYDKEATSQVPYITSVQSYTLY